MRHADAVPQQDVHLVLVDVHAVRGDDLGIQDAVILQPGHDGHPMLGQVVLYLLLGLGDVDMESRSKNKVKSLKGCKVQFKDQSLLSLGSMG